MKNKTAIVTGGGKGIGRQICYSLAEKGANVVINYSHSEEDALHTAEICKELGADCITFKADVSKADECAALVKATLEKYGAVDILVNNAGITKDNLLMRMSEDEFDKVIAVNLKGAFNMMQAVARIMMKQRSGRIINMSSVVGLLGNAGQTNYCASKAGIIGMTKSFAREIASRKVTVNAIAPGFIETDMTAALPVDLKEKLLGQIPLGTLGACEDIANAVLFLASEEARYITGQTLSVDGGMSMR